jgi:phosphatidate cytidylyltransferase
LKTRIISALVGIPLFLGLCYWGREPYAIAVFVVTALAMYELSAAWRRAGIQANLLVLSLGLVIPMYAWTNWLDSSQGMHWVQGTRLDAICFIGGLSLLIAAVAEVLRAGRTGDLHVARNLGYGLLGATYLSLFSTLTWLRADTSPAQGGVLPEADAGFLYTLLTVFCVWATDSFAYFVGSKFGKTKLAPHLSPGKSWEGAAGGFAAALVIGAVFGHLLLGRAGVGLVVGGVAGTLGQVGDLFKSALKREVGIKDFGGILPGHGGALDRFDSLLFVAPIACIVFGLFR